MYLEIFYDYIHTNSNANFALVSQAFHEEYSRLHELSQEEITPQEDARLQHALVYFFQNKAPKRVIERTLLEQFTDRNLSFDERCENRQTAPLSVFAFCSEFRSYHHSTG